MRFEEGTPIPSPLFFGMSTGSRLMANKDVDHFLGKREGYTDLAMVLSGAGVNQRYWVETGKEATSDLAVRALRQAMSAGNILPSEIGTIFLATSSPDRHGSSTAAAIQEALGIPNNLFSSNIADACPGFVNALRRTYTELTSPLRRKGYYAVIGAEVLSVYLGMDEKRTDKREKKKEKENIAILGGDGAGAVIVDLVVPDKGAPTEIGFGFRSDGKYAESLGIEAGGSRLPAGENTFIEGRHLLRMDGEVVFEQAIPRMTEAALDALRDAGVSAEEIDVLVPHQANKKIIEGVAKNLGISMKKVVMVIDKYGNSSAASIPMAMYEGIKSGQIRRNYRIAVCAFGGGLTAGAAVFPAVGLPKS